MTYICFAHCISIVIGATRAANRSVRSTPQVVDVSTSKTGKHGHAKCNFVGVDIFTGKKYEDMCPSSHNCDVPNISRKEYTLMDINNEGYLSLMEENGTIREDLKLPTGTDEADKLAESIQAQYEAGEELVVSVLKAMGDEMVNSVKAVNQNAGN